MKKNPILIILLAALVLGALFFGMLYLFSSFSGQKHPQVFPVGRSDKVGLVKIEGVLLLSDSGCRGIA